MSDDLDQSETSIDRRASEGRHHDTGSSIDGRADAGVTGSRRSHRRSVLISAGAVPLMVIGGFAMLAIVPVVLVVRAAFRDDRLRPLRPWALVLGITYATPLALWGILPDRAPSLTKDMHPAFVPLICVAAVAFLAAHTVTRRRRVATSQG